MRCSPLLLLFLSACVHFNKPNEISVARFIVDRNVFASKVFKVVKFPDKEKNTYTGSRAFVSLTQDTCVWSRIRKGFRIEPRRSVEIEQQIQNYAKRPESFSKMLERSRPYLFYVLGELEKRGMPTELALIPFVESAYNPQALSSAKAAGMWQFIPSTGKEYKLQQNFFSDERRDVLASTDAALGYLEKLYVMFGDWRLALAAYNWGEGNVQRSIRRNLIQKRPADYAHLKLPKETRSYVPKIEAIKAIILEPKKFGILLPVIPNCPYFVTVTTSRDIDIQVAAKLADLSLEDFYALNPAFNRPVILGSASPQILLPYKNANLFERGLKTYGRALSSWTVYKLAQSEYPEVLARKVGMNLKNFMAVNKIPYGVRLRSGSVVLIPKYFRSTSDQDIDAFIAKNAVLNIESDKVLLKKRIVRTQTPFTVLAFAKKHKVPVVRLRQWNPKLPKKIIPTGTSVVLHVPLRNNPAIRKRKVKGVQIAKNSICNRLF